MVLTTVLLVVSTVALPVDTGTESPTRSVATWLLITTSDGFESTLTLVTVCSASRMAVGLASDPSRKLKPGRTRLIKPLATAVVMLLAVELVVAELVALVVVVVLGGDVARVLSADPLSAGRPKPWLFRKNWTP